MLVPPWLGRLWWLAVVAPAPAGVLPRPTFRSRPSVDERRPPLSTTARVELNTAGIRDENLPATALLCRAFLAHLPGPDGTCQDCGLPASAPMPVRAAR